MKTDEYFDGRQAVGYMRYHINFLLRKVGAIDKDDEDSKLFRMDLKTLNEMYQEARTVAMVFGTDVSIFPRRLKLNTRSPKWKQTYST